LRAESGYGGYSAEVDTAEWPSLIWFGDSDQQSRRDFSAALQKARGPKRKRRRPFKARTKSDKSACRFFEAD
jgi:hypothetical protein